MFETFRLYRDATVYIERTVNRDTQVLDSTSVVRELCHHDPKFDQHPTFSLSSVRGIFAKLYLHNHSVVVLPDDAFAASLYSRLWIPNKAVRGKTPYIRDTAAVMTH